MRKTAWEGIFVAIWSPTDLEGRILEHALSAHLKFLFQHQIHGVMALGSTGEFLFLDIPQKQQLLRTVTEAAAARAVRVIANVSDIQIRRVETMARFARECRADAIAVLPPYFYPVAQADLVEFFVRAADAAQLPVFLYNFPERTGNRIALETVAAVADRIPLAGVKQSGGEFEYHKELIQLGREKNFTVLTGSDPLLADAMSLGASGNIGGLSNAVPDLMADFYAAIRANNLERIKSLRQQLGLIGEQMNRIEFPLNVAALMKARGLEIGAFKRPVAPGTMVAFDRLVSDLRRLLDQWSLPLA